MSTAKSLGARAKVCGITRYEDAVLALDLGAWALGFIFHPSSPRWIEPAVARDLVARLPRETRTIGVFVDRPETEVQEIVHHVGLWGVQLHGSEPPAVLATVRAAGKIKAFRVGEKFDTAVVAPYRDVLVLLDTHRPDRPGGTGEIFDWDHAVELARSRDVILAGGIGPENVAEAVRQVRPYAVDASSRLEAKPGVKDARRMKEFFERLMEVKAGES